MAKKPVKKRNPQDTTLRNTRATHKREEELKGALDDLLIRVAALENQFTELRERVYKVEQPV